MGLFRSHSSSSNATCPATTRGPQYGVGHIIGSLTFHDLKFLCGAFTAIVLLISGIHLLLHATHFGNLGEQVRILRIISLVPIYALADFYESVALANYFLLLITYVVPNPERRDGVFDRLEHKQGGGSRKWYRRTWIFVFQYIPISFGVALATDITQAVGILCPNGNGVHFAHIWLTVINSISVALAFLRLLAFYKRLRSQLSEHNITAKLFAIKGIVFVVFVQQIIFTALNSTGAVKPSTKFTYNDIYYGIPSILICGEMVVFSLFNLYAYSARPYYLTSKGHGAIESQKLGDSGSQYHGEALGGRSLIMALNPLEILKAIVQAQAAEFVGLSPEVPHNDSGLSMHSPECQPVAPYRAHSPDSVEHGNMEQYTPLPRRQY